VKNRRDVDRFAARLEVLPFDPDAADIRTGLERQGQVIGPMTC
jgi:tRNA(fMet)-specific endonuclease VapC